MWTVEILRFHFDFHKRLGRTLENGIASIIHICFIVFDFTEACELRFRKTWNLYQFEVDRIHVPFDGISVLFYLFKNTIPVLYSLTYSNDLQTECNECNEWAVGSWMKNKILDFFRAN